MLAATAPNALCCPRFLRVTSVKEAGTEPGTGNLGRSHCHLFQLPLSLLVHLQATKFTKLLQGLGCSYSGTVRLGTATDTFDASGQVVSTCDWQHITGKCEPHFYEQPNAVLPIRRFILPFGLSSVGPCGGLMGNAARSCFARFSISLAP